MTKMDEALREKLALEKRKAERVRREVAKAIEREIARRMKTFAGPLNRARASMETKKQ